jgi:hypothetical protein
LSVIDDWSRVGGESVSPYIRFFLGIDGSGSSGFGISVLLEDGSRKDTVVEGVTIWVGCAHSLDLHGGSVGDKSDSGKAEGVHFYLKIFIKFTIR